MHGGNLGHPTARPGMAGRSGALIVMLWLAGNIIPSAARAGSDPEATIGKIIVQGNRTVETSKILQKLKSREGRALDEEMLIADKKALHAANWFSNIDFHKISQGNHVYDIMITVSEMPILTGVEFRGRNALRLKELEEATDLKVGSRADPIRAQIARRQIESLYHEKGYELAEVALVEGGKPGQTRVIYEIYEGPRVRIPALSVHFEGNSFVASRLLMTKVKSSSWMPSALRWLKPNAGARTSDMIDEDVRILTEYYQSIGFLEAKVSPIRRPGKDLGSLDLTFVIAEGPRYMVRDIRFEGNEQLKTELLREGMTLHSGTPYTDMARDGDLKRLNTKYSTRGFLFAQVLPEPRFTDQPGVVDLVYKIEEGDPVRLGELIIKGNTITKDEVIRREALMAGVLPGELLNSERIGAFKSRLGNTGFFVTSPELGKPIDVRVINKRPAGKPYMGSDPLDDLMGGGSPFARMQAPEELPPLLPEPKRDEEIEQAQAAPRMSPLDAVPFGAGDAFRPETDALPEPIQVAPIPRNTLPPGADEPPVRVLPDQPLEDTKEPKEIMPSFPSSNLYDVGPDRNDPYANRGFADLMTQVQEGPTGRFMLGAGVSSFGGLNGTFIYHESNFDITRFPKSWQDLRELRAFRGGGQDLRIELSPGTVINRALISFREPYLFFVGDWPVSLAASAYTFSRFYPYYNETRTGGRFALAQQFSPSLQADVAFRVEDVGFNGFSYPAPADYLAALGHSTLMTIRPSVRYDTRNSPVAPSEGFYVEGAFEQGFGTYTFPKGTIEARQYKTIYSRPDGDGKHIISTRAYFGMSGYDTPVFERFFAGDWRSLRGFAYQGVGPFQYGKNTGGIFSMLGSVEYQFPITANDRFNGVVFSDFGTVESSYSINDFRVAVGTGLRIMIPQFKLPIAVDLAFPIVKAHDDKERLVTFFIGAFW